MAVHLFNIRVYSEDTDCFGVVYHAQYLCFMSRARGEWLRSVGMTVDSFANEGYVFAIHSADLKFHRPARLGDLLVVETRLVDVRRTSFTAAHRIWVDGQTEIICEGNVGLAFLNYHTMRPCAMPENLSAEIKRGS